MQNAPPPPPLSRVLNIENLGEAELHFTIEADASQRKSSADFLGLVAIDHLLAELSIRRWRKRGLKIEGRFSADVVQECVVTLLPVPAHLEAPILASFLPEAEVFALEEGVDMEAYLAATEDPPEPYDEKQIDLGALVLEFLSLALEPYPRTPGATLPPEYTLGDGA